MCSLVFSSGVPPTKSPAISIHANSNPPGLPTSCALWVTFLLYCSKNRKYSLSRNPWGFCKTTNTHVKLALPKVGVIEKPCANCNPLCTIAFQLLLRADVSPDEATPKYSKVPCVTSAPTHNYPKTYPSMIMLNALKNAMPACSLQRPVIIKHWCWKSQYPGAQLRGIFYLLRPYNMTDHSRSALWAHGTSYDPMAYPMIIELAQWSSNIFSASRSSDVKWKTSRSIKTSQRSESAHSSIMGCPAITASALPIHNGEVIATHTLISKIMIARHARRSFDKSCNHNTRLTVSMHVVESHGNSVDISTCDMHWALHSNEKLCQRFITLKANDTPSVWWPTKNEAMGDLQSSMQQITQASTT